MGAKQSRPQTRKSSSPKVELAPRPQTRKSSSPKVELASRHETRRNNTSALRIRIPKHKSSSNRSTSNRSSSESGRALHFDKSLKEWAKITEDFASDSEAEYFVYMFYDPTHGRSKIENDEYIVPSPEVMAWAGNNYSRLVEFCGNEVSEDPAYLRFAGGDDEPAYESALMLAIRRDGRILGFAAIEGWNSPYPHLNDICVAKKRRGIGREIINTYMGYAYDNNATKLSLDSVRTAVPFYQSLGFDFETEKQREAYAKKRYGQYKMVVRIEDYEFAD
jgi:GNAT superfamily N-acetyltransferase